MYIYTYDSLRRCIRNDVSKTVVRKKLLKKYVYQGNIMQQDTEATLRFKSFFFFQKLFLKKKASRVSRNKATTVLQVLTSSKSSKCYLLY